MTRPLNLAPGGYRPKISFAARLDSCILAAGSETTSERGRQTEKNNMPNMATELSVLVGSPGDVTEERERLEQVVSSVNSAFAGTGISLRLIRWEHDVRPGLGEDGQAVVNDEIPEDYDVFIGIMWNSVGTPTGRAISGTIEEFEKAVERFDKDPSSIRGNDVFQGRGAYVHGRH